MSAPRGSPAANPGSGIANDIANDIAALLEEDIIFGRLHPRERLIEDELMLRFGVKRHVVRDVLLALERMGLVERRKNAGALVRSFTPLEVTELYGLRALLEMAAARQIVLPVPPEKLAALIAVQEQHDAAVREQHLARVFRSNLAFHQTLFQLSGNETLQRAIAEYARQTHPIRFGALVAHSYRERAREEHWSMIEALRTGDQASLLALCFEHLLPSRDAYLAAQAQS